MSIRTKIIGWGSAVSPLLVPLFASAQTLGWFSSVLTQLQGLVTQLVPFLIGLAVVVFFWGIVKYVTAGADDEKKKTARSLMIYGVIALFVMVSLWGIVTLLQSITGTTGVTSVPTPVVPGGRGLLP